LLLHILETVIFRHDQPFVSNAIEHLVGFTIRRSFHDERLLAEVKLAYNPVHGDAYVWPEITYRITPTLHAFFQARVITGDRSQLIGEYRDHDEVVVGMRRFF